MNYYDSAENSDSDEQQNDPDSSDNPGAQSIRTVW